jgi:hypothetical protein
MKGNGEDCSWHREADMLLSVKAHLYLAARAVHVHLRVGSPGCGRSREGGGDVSSAALVRARRKKRTSGAKALIVVAFTARLKPCPDTKHEFFRSL